MKYFKKFFYLFDDLNKKITFLVVITFLSSLFEILGLGLIAPIVSGILDPEKLNSFEAFKIFFNVEYSHSTFFTILGLAIIICYFVKAILTWHIIRIIHSYCYHKQVDLRERIYKNFFNMPFVDYGSKTFSKKYSSIIEITRNITEVTLIGFLKFISDALILLLVACFLFYIDSTITLITLFFLFLIYFTYKYFMHKKIYSYGKDSLTSMQEILNNAEATLGSLKEIKIFNKENYFIKLITKHSKKFAASMVKYNLAGSLPKLIIETLAITLLVVFFIILINFGNGSQNNFEVLAIFSMAILRLAPTVYHLLIGYGNLQNSKFYIDTLYDQLIETELSSSVVRKKIDFITQIKIKNGTFKYNEETLFENLNVEINRHDLVGIFGPSGSGKTTFLHIILGLVNLKTGQKFYNNKIVDNSNEHLINNVGYISQDPYLLEDSIKANIVFDEFDDINNKKLMEVISQSSLINLIARNQEGINQLVGFRGSSVSGGQRQRIAIARALYNNKELLILDEPSSYLDNYSKKQFINTINKIKSSKTIVIVSHDKEIIDICEKKFQLINKSLVRLD